MGNASNTLSNTCFLRHFWLLTELYLKSQIYMGPKMNSYSWFSSFQKISINRRVRAWVTSTTPPSVYLQVYNLMCWGAFFFHSGLNFIIGNSDYETVE